MMPVVIVYIVRHGETEENRRAIIQGQRDTELNDAGRTQAHQVGSALEKIPFKKAWSSDLCRAAATAEEILKHHPDLELVKQPALRERYMGEWEGKAVKDRHAASRADASGRGQESVPDMSARVAQWWDENVHRYVKEVAGSVAIDGARDGGREEGSVSEGPVDPHAVLVVSHGYFIGLLLRGLIDSGTIGDAVGIAGGRVGNASVTVVEIGSDGRGLLSKFSDMGHLTGTQAWAGSTEADSHTR
ncbi:phosphoglycerate mutase-like protein [Vararia minispora EC-137]|uniref:Phosphoglycerate mutase-like protein n=1 Tax=Vararia minispora EC-137 TaxID=1314806 RepID=A0ACB8QGT0_9AGAM|nr:phosphoglycerate mutase-like protein [Vararia minispora EC-137]